MKRIENLNQCYDFLLEVYVVSFIEGAVARHQAIAGKLIAALQTHTINIRKAARLSVILAGYVIGSVIAQYLNTNPIQYYQIQLKLFGIYKF